MRRFRVLLLVVSAPFFSAGCGYHWSFSPDTPSTLSLAPIRGDDEGMLQREIALAFAGQGPCRLASPSESAYELFVSLEPLEAETIGFRFDLQDISGVVSENLVAAEGRRRLKATVSLHKKGEEEPAAGPYTLYAQAEYDYLDGDSLEDLAFLNSAGQMVTVLPFSLGQLEPKESAHDSAALPLYRQLARKIADAVYARW